MIAHIIKPNSGAVLITLDGASDDEKQLLLDAHKHGVHVTACGLSDDFVRLQIATNNVADPLAGYFYKGKMQIL